jgi:dTDP-4-amino-4,6-dideoxygalactose transaminase
LEKNGIETAIHYPTPIHLQPSAKRFGYTKGSFKIAEKQSKKILTLPINQYLKRKEIDLVIKHINHFYN